MLTTGDTSSGSEEEGEQEAGWSDDDICIEREADEGKSDTPAEANPYEMPKQRLRPLPPSTSTKKTKKKSSKPEGKQPSRTYSSNEKVLKKQSKGSRVRCSYVRLEEASASPPSLHGALHALRHVHVLTLTPSCR